MCDYSLQGLPNRLAVAGEQLLTYRFWTSSIGMASPYDIAAASRPKLQTCKQRGWWSALKSWLNPRMELDQVPAVCIPPGTRLRMTRVPEQMQRSDVLRPMEEVTFVQLSAEAYRYRDAIRFDNGCLELLQTFAEGVPFQVLSLDVDEQKPEPEAQILVFLDEAA
jgi:hypothetical protein